MTGSGKGKSRCPFLLGKDLIRMDATNCTGIALDSTLLVQVGAALGVVGALAFASFAVNVPLKLDASKRAL